MGAGDPGRPRLSEVADVTIVGAGAAGLATAIFTRRLNPSRSVLLLDGAVRPGAKILVSGGSRCNVTNASVTEGDFSGGKPTIIRRVLRAFTVRDTITWFAQLGVPLHEEPHGKLFPDSNRSRDVLDALLRDASLAGVKLMAATRVLEITRGPDEFHVHTSRGIFTSRTVVLATGGKSLPKTGSDGFGLELAQRLGHTIVPTTPALVPLVAEGDEPLHQRLTGVSMDVELSVWVARRMQRRIAGSLLWTHFGVSGPVVLDASRHWLRALLEEQDRPGITISLLPGESFEQLEAHWSSLTQSRPRVSIHTALAERIPASVSGAVLAQAGVDPATVLATLARPDRRRLSHALVDLQLPVTSSRGYNYAEATAGGVALDEIDPGTMASRRCAGLYLVGEMLDVDGRIGGFNFQWAWSSARAAARDLALRQ